jgi:hypothetical protein
MDDMEQIFRSGTSPDRWLRLNTPDPDLIYKSRQARQLTQIGSVVTIFHPDHVSMKVVGQHTSKSVSLPVSCIKFQPYDQVYTYCFIRDNFYDIKLCVVSDGPVKIPFNLIYGEWSEEKLEEERQRYIAYRGHEDESEIKFKAYVNDNWYHEDWSGGKIIRKDGRIYVGSKSLACYCEGINRLGLPDEAFEMYDTDKKIFGVSLSDYGQLAHVLEYVDRSLEKYRSVWLDNGGRERLPAS